MTTFSTPVDYPAMAALIKNDLAQIGINVNIVAAGPGHVRRQEQRRRLRLGPHRPRDARRRRRLRRRVQPGASTARTRRGSPAGTARRGNPKPMLAGSIGNGRITLDTKKRLPMYQKLNKVLMDEMLEVPLVSVSKFHVVNKRLKNMYVAFTDFNPGLRTAYLVKLDERHPSGGPGTCRPAAALLETACPASSSSELAALFATLFAVSVVIFMHGPAAAGQHHRPLLRRRQRGDAGAEAGGEEAARPDRLVLRSSTGTGSAGVLHGDFGHSLPDRSSRLGDHEDRAADRHRAGLPRAPDRARRSACRSGRSRPCRRDSAARLHRPRHRPRSGSASRTSGSRRCCCIFTSRVLPLGAAARVRPVLRGPGQEPAGVHPAGDRDLGLHARDRDADGARDDARGAEPRLRAHGARQGRAAPDGDRASTRSATR